VCAASCPRCAHLTPPLNASIYNKLIHVRTFLAPNSGLLQTNPLRADIPIAEVEAAYGSSGVAVVDSLLRPEVFSELRNCALEVPAQAHATVGHQTPACMHLSDLLFMFDGLR